MSPAGVAHLALGAAIGSSERVEFGRGSTRGGGESGEAKDSLCKSKRIPDTRDFRDSLGVWIVKVI